MEKLNDLERVTEPGILTRKTGRLVWRIPSLACRARCRSQKPRNTSVLPSMHLQTSWGRGGFGDRDWLWKLDSLEADPPRPGAFGRNLENKSLKIF